MTKHRTNRKRNRQMKVKAMLSKEREDAQLEGVLPTTPEGAVRNEVVDPASQSEQRFPHLDLMAVRKGWNVPDAEKPLLVDRVIAIAKSDDQGALAVIAAVRTLSMLDDKQQKEDEQQEDAEMPPAKTMEEVKAFFEMADRLRQPKPLNLPGGEPT